MNDSLGLDRIKLRRYREASEWLLRLNGPSPSEQEVEQWLFWCEAHSENLSAFEKLQRDWQDTEGFKTAPELLGEAQPVEINHHAQISASWTRRARNSSAFRWALAASLVLLTVVGLQHWERRVPDREIVSTSNQEPTTLPDGSSLLLSAKATVEVDFSGTARHVALRPGSEAYIKVHHDKTRPFTVRAGAMTVTAVGTAFDVRRELNRVTVTVEEGTILASAIGTMTVVVRDPALLKLRFTGTVFVASVNDWVTALEAKYPLHAVMSPGGNIALQYSAMTVDSPKH